MPRNLEDLKDFASSEPAITEVTPHSLSFTEAGGKQDIKVILQNAEGKA